MVRGFPTSKAGNRMLDEGTFRRVMGHFATGVTVVTVRRPEGGFLGLTVNAFTSVSLDPLLVLVCINRGGFSHDELLASGAFAVNVLGREQEDLAQRFATGDPRTRFRGLNAEAGPSGSPLLEGALAWLDCEIHETHRGGDHSIIVGRVLACHAREGDPLLFFRGRLRGMES